MKFFAKIVFIFNICFVGFAILRYIEQAKKITSSTDAIAPLPWLKQTVVLLGWTSIFINLLFCLIAMVFYLSKKSNLLAKWLTIANFIFLLLQIYYFFIYNG
jgi:hypothetical protein